MSKEKDKILRKNLAKPSVRMLNRVLGLNAVKVETLSPVLIQTMLERAPDNLLLVTLTNGKRIIIHWEFQVNNDHRMVRRNAIYDYMIYDQQKLPVLTIVLYIGKGRLNMKNKISFFNNHYSCEIIDIRTLDPEIFLQSPDSKEVIMAVLAGPDDEAQKRIIIIKIITKLRQMLRHSDIEFMESMTELELLAQVRGPHIQQLINKEVTTMWMIEGLDKRKSLFYQEAQREAKRETKREIALNLIKEGIDIPAVHRCTGVAMRTLLRMKKEALLLSVPA